MKSYIDQEKTETAFLHTVLLCIIPSPSQEHLPLKENQLFSQGLFKGSEVSPEVEI